MGVVLSESIAEAWFADDEEIDLRTSSAVASANIIRSYLEYVSMIKITELLPSVEQSSNPTELTSINCHTSKL